MTRGELLQARVAWLTLAMRGLLKERAERYQSAGAVKYTDSTAGKADQELRGEEEKYENQNFGPILLRFLRKKAQQVLEEWMETR